MPSSRFISRPDRQPLTPERLHALSAFYRTYHRRLARRVYRWMEAITPWEIEDACSFAWLQLTRRSDINLDRGGYAWISTVAIREARRITHTPAPHQPTDPAISDDDPLLRALASETHDERLQRFAQLKSRERRDLLLLAAGYSYREIAALTGSTYTAVNRRITEGRARLLHP